MGRQAAIPTSSGLTARRPETTLPGRGDPHVCGAAILFVNCFAARSGRLPVPEASAATALATWRHKGRSSRLRGRRRVRPGVRAVAGKIPVPVGPASGRDDDGLARAEDLALAGPTEENAS